MPGIRRSSTQRRCFQAQWADVSAGWHMLSLFQEMKMDFWWKTNKNLCKNKDRIVNTKAWSWGRETGSLRKGLFNVCWAKLNSLNLCQANLVIGGFVLVTHVISMVSVLWDSSHCRMNSLCTWIDRMLLFSGCRVEGCDWGREWGKVRSPRSSLLEKHVRTERGNEGWLVLPARGCSKGLHLTAPLPSAEVAPALRTWLYLASSGFSKHTGVSRVGLHFFFLKQQRTSVVLPPLWNFRWSPDTQLTTAIRRRQ